MRAWSARLRLVVEPKSLRHGWCQARNEYDKTIQETEARSARCHVATLTFEAAYMKILESSQTLLHVLKRETAPRRLLF